jgi:two-component system chemotaxis sensor kinase CheA
VDQTQREFLVELEELVELIFADLNDLRASLSDGAQQRQIRDLVDRTFRHIHSVKGSAASTGLETVSQIAHEFENLLDGVRCGRTLLNQEALDACELATEALAESLSHLASETAAPSHEALFDQLRAAAQSTANDPGSDTEAILSSIPSEIWQSLTQSEKHRVISVVEEETPLFLVTTSFDLSNFDEEFFRLKEKLGENGEVISTSPTVDDEQPGKINFRVLYASKIEPASMEASVIEFSEVVFNKVQSAANPVPSKDYEFQPLASVSSLANFVRTDLGKLDQLISSTHELLRATSNALGFALSQAEITPRARAELQGLDQQIKKSFMSVEDELINLRMVSLSPTLQRVMRAGRAAARKAGKEIDFEIVGAHIELDKLLVDAIADPLIHLVRNAVDHGIENIERRVQANKNRRGIVRIEAHSEGSQSRLRVTDDGRGIDPLFISEAAAKLGIAETESIDFERSLRLIFRPGFTTVESVSDVSGRGVGLDVVETAVEQVGGELRVSSKPGLGTTFEIRLPVTFGLLQATVFVSGDNRYCIPASQTLAIGMSELPPVSMRELLGQSPRDTPEQTESDGQSEVITCEFSDERSGSDANATKSIRVLVDAVEGTEEVLVRTLGRHAGRWYGVAGATELRDGTVALVLDLPRLLSGAE